MLANWVKQAVTAGGTGNLTLGSADAGHIDINTVIGQGPRFSYVIEDGVNRESGIGHLSAATTFVRDIIYETLVSGVLTRSAPSPINVTTTAKVMIAPTARNIFAAALSSLVDVAGSGAVANAGFSTLNIGSYGAGAMVVTQYMLMSYAIANNLAIDISGASAGVSVVGIYAPSAANSAIKLAQSGELDTGTTGLKSSALSTTLYLPPGIYLAVIHNSGNPFIRGGVAIPTAFVPKIEAAAMHAYVKSSSAFGYSSTLPNELTFNTFAADASISPRVLLF